MSENKFDHWALIKTGIGAIIAGTLAYAAIKNEIKETAHTTQKLEIRQDKMDDRFRDHDKDDAQHFSALEADVKNIREGVKYLVEGERRRSR